MTARRPKVLSVQVDTKTVLLVVLGIIQLLNSYVVLKTQQDVQTVHVATNSMKDALVKAARIEGNLEGRTQQKAEANQKEP